MKTIEKTIRPFGNSAGIIIDNTMKFLSGINVGDIVEVTCSNNKIIIKKKGE